MSSTEVGIEEARGRLGSLVTAAQQGTTIVLTRNGRPAAQITAYQEEPIMQIITNVEVAHDAGATTEYAGWGSIPGNGYREFQHDVEAQLDDPAEYDVPTLVDAYRDAINQALAEHLPGCQLAGDQFIGPYPAPDHTREQIAEAIGAVDFWALTERHAR